MTYMSIQDIHERLMLYKMVKEISEKKDKPNQCTSQVNPSWLCNLKEEQIKQ